MSKCGAICEIYSRCCGYFRPVANWNLGKKEEFKDRKMFDVLGLKKKHGERKDVRSHKNGETSGPV